MASIVVAGDTSGTVTLAAPAVSGTTTLTLPTTSGTVLTTAASQTLTTPSVVGPLTMTSGGITFNANPGGGTQATLNDYEVGTFSPTLSCTGCTFTYLYQNGWYTKVGKMVTVGMTIGLSGITGNSGNTNSVAVIVPFVAASGANEVSTPSIGYRESYTTNFPNAGYLSQGTSSVWLIYSPLAAVSVNIKGQNLLSNSYIDLSITYQAAS